MALTELHKEVASRMTNNFKFTQNRSIRGWVTNKKKSYFRKTSDVPFSVINKGDTFHHDLMNNILIEYVDSSTEQYLQKFISFMDGSAENDVQYAKFAKAVNALNQKILKRGITTAFANKVMDKIFYTNPHMTTVL
jgi:RecA/RadA recombinase